MGRHFLPALFLFHNSMENDSTYQTKNLFVASYILASRKIQFLGTKVLDSKTKLFVFCSPEIARELETDYFSGGTVAAKNLFAEYNSLKDLLFQRDPNRGKAYERFE